MTTLERIKLEITSHFLWNGEVKTDIPYTAQVCLDIIDKYAEQEPCDDAVSRDFQIGDEVRIIGSDPIYDDCDVGWVIRNASEKVKTMYVMRNDGSAGEEAKAEWYKTGRHNAVLAEVIKALPSVTQKPIECDDVVSRQAVLDRREILRDEQGTGYQAVKTKYIRELPSVRPQEQTGHWEMIVKEHKCYARDDTYTTTEYLCSECGAEPFENEDGFYELSNYCPNCGARMESEVRNENNT